MFSKGRTGIYLILLIYCMGTSCRKTLVKSTITDSSIKYILTGNHDIVSKVERTPDGGFLYCGKTGQDTINTQAFLLKLDSLGNKVFYKTYGGPNFDQFCDAIQCSDGGYIAVGCTNSMGKGVSDLNFCLLDYIVKTDALGNELWSRSFSVTSGGKAQFNRVIESPDHFYYATGYHWVNSITILFCKFDNTGKKLIFKTLNNFSLYPPYIIGTSWREYGLSLTVNKEGNIIIGGMMNPSSAINQIENYISFLISITSDGAVNFFYPYYNYIRVVDSYVRERLPGMRVLNQDDGYLMITSFDIPESKIVVQIVKTDLNGAPVWEKRIQGLGTALVSDAVEQKDGNILITGSSTTALIDDSYPEFFSNLKLMVLKIDRNGNLISEHYFGSQDNANLGKSIQPNPDGGWTLTGYTCQTNSGYDNIFNIQLKDNLELKK